MAWTAIGIALVLIMFYAVFAWWSELSAFCVRSHHVLQGLLHSASLCTACLGFCSVLLVGPLSKRLGLPTDLMWSGSLGASIALGLACLFHGRYHAVKSLLLLAIAAFVGSVLGLVAEG